MFDDRLAYAWILVAISSSLALADTPKSSPFRGVAQVIPGKVEAEHYDEGKPGVAYHDVDEVNKGANYRGETQVDIEKRPDASNGYGIGWTRNGEWLMYTVDVKESGVYSLKISVASNRRGGTFRLEFGGKNVTGSITVPDTGGWQKLKVIEMKGVRLNNGRQLMKMVMEEVGPSGNIGDIDYVEFTKTE